MFHVVFGAVFGVMFGAVFGVVFRVVFFGPELLTDSPWLNPGPSHCREKVPETLNLPLYESNLSESIGLLMCMV